MQTEQKARFLDLHQRQGLWAVLLAKPAIDIGQEQILTYIKEMGQMAIFRGWDTDFSVRVTNFAPVFKDKKIVTMNDKLTTMNELANRQAESKISMILGSRRAALAEKNAKKA